MSDFIHNGALSHIVRPWAVLDALPDHIAILNMKGTIIAVNTMWQRFADQNGFVGTGYCIGNNYLDVCDAAEGDCSEEAHIVAQGIRSMIAGRRELFELEYPCHSPDEQRWFLVRVTCIEEEGAPLLVVSHQNITRRKLAERQLRLLESAVVNASDAVLITRADTIDLPGPEIVYVNEEFTRMTGYQPDEVIGKTPRILQGPGTQPAARAQMRSALQKAEPIRVEVLNYRKDGSEFWVELDIVPVHDEYGQLTHFVSIQRDTTERKRSEEALRASEERLRSIFENATIGIFQTTPQGTILSANPALAHMLGYDTPGELSEHITNIGEQVYVNPACRASLVRQIQENHGAAHLEVQFYRRDRTIITVNLHIWVVSNNQSDTTHLEGFVEDITEQKHAASMLHLQAAALQAAAHGIVIADRHGTIEWVNPAFIRATGYSWQEIVGKNVRFQKSGRQSQVFYEQMWQTILAGQVWQGELINRRKDGTLRIDEVTITPVRETEEGEISHFIGIEQDITERRQHERELEAIASVSAALRVAPDRSAMLPIVLDNLHDIFSTDGIVLIMCSPDGDTLQVELAQGSWAAAKGSQFSCRAMMNSLSPSGPQPNLLDDMLQLDPRMLWPYLTRKIVDAVPIALTAQEHTLGVIWIGRSTGFSDSECNVLAAIGDIAANAIHRATLHEQVEQRLNRLAAINKIDRAINASTDLNVTLDVLLPQATTQLGVDAAAILLLNEHSQMLHYVAGYGFRTTSFQQVTLRLGEGHAGAAAAERRLVSVPDIKLLGEAFIRSRLLASEHFLSYYAMPIIARGQIKGVLELFHRTPLQPDQEWLDFLDTLAGQVAIAIDNAELVANLQQSNDELTLAYDATIEGWARALELRDAETEGHSRRVTDLTLQLAHQMGLSDDDLVHMRRGAILHDIGKMAIPDRILLKPGPLTAEEWRVMRKHPTYAYEWLSPIRYLCPALDIPHYHHERWDGSGYPRGLKGQQIPLAARIFAVVDVWDALCSDRPYRAAWPHEEVRTYLQQHAGVHFDPQIVEVFLNLDTVRVW
jgi:PAS domain S-box-containing protein